MRNDTLIPKKFATTIMRNDQSKTQPFELVAAGIADYTSTKIAIATNGKDVVSNSAIRYENLSPCNKEDAVSRVFCHVNDMSLDYRKLLILTVDTDLVLIALSVFFNLCVDELWIEFGSGKDRKWIPIHLYAQALGERRCRVLPFWYAFTGCDMTSQFAGHGKKSTWKIWTDIPDITDTFIRLSTLCEISAEDKQIIERFICVLYDPSSKCSCVNECRRYLFSAKSRSIDNCPPTSCALEQHIKRSQLQARNWTQSLRSVDEDIEPTQWSWSRNENGFLEPLWSTLPIAADVCVELRRCKCKTICSGKCSSKKSGLMCTELCLCSGQCL